MTKSFDELPEKERTKLLHTPALISAIAAGRDGELDEKEKRMGLELAHLRTFTSHPSLREFYKRAEPLFQSNLEIIVDRYRPFDAQQIEEMKKELKNAYRIMDQLNQDYADLLKESLASYAEHVSQAHPKLEDYLDLSIL